MATDACTRLGCTPCLLPASSVRITDFSPTELGVAGPEANHAVYCTTCAITYYTHCLQQLSPIAQQEKIVMATITEADAFLKTLAYPCPVAPARFPAGPHMVLDLRCRIRDQIQALAASSSQNDAMVDWLRGTIHSLSRLHNSRTSVSMLPEDIFVMICGLCSTRDRVNIARVCSSWRRMAISSPKLWTSIVIDTRDPSSLPFSDELIRRAQDQPLDLTLVVDTELNQLTADQLSLVGGPLAPGRASRLRTLNLSVWRPYTFFSVLDLSSSAEALETLALNSPVQVVCRQGCPALKTFFGGRTPSLRKLTLHNVFFSIDSPIYHGLVCLELGGIKHAAAKTSEILTVLRQTPLLRELVFRQTPLNSITEDVADDLHKDGFTVSLPHLEHFAMSGDYDGYQNIVRFLDVPRTTKMRFTDLFISDDYNGALVDLIPNVGVFNAADIGEAPTLTLHIDMSTDEAECFFLLYPHNTEFDWTPDDRKPPPENIRLFAQFRAVDTSGSHAMGLFLALRSMVIDLAVKRTLQCANLHDVHTLNVRVHGSLFAWAPLFERAQRVRRVVIEVDLEDMQDVLRILALPVVLADEVATVSRNRLLPSLVELHLTMEFQEGQADEQNAMLPELVKMAESRAGADLSLQSLVLTGFPPLSRQQTEALRGSVQFIELVLFEDECVRQEPEI